MIRMIKKANIFQMFPKFILRDTDGFAMARALEAGMNYFLDKCNEAVETILDPAKMPEWRLDEMAWELNCLYDYAADVDVKREWIANAYWMYRIHGTPEGVRQYLKTYFGESSIQEYWTIEDGEPGQFNVIVMGIRTDENEAWIRNAVKKAKNVRSELNLIIFNANESDALETVGAATQGVAIVVGCKMY